MYNVQVLRHMTAAKQKKIECELEIALFKEINFVNLLVTGRNEKTYIFSTRARVRPHARDIAKFTNLHIFSFRLEFNLQSSHLSTSLKHWHAV